MKINKRWMDDEPPHPIKSCTREYIKIVLNGFER